jgi:hypothetical protein
MIRTVGRELSTNVLNGATVSGIVEITYYWEDFQDNSIDLLFSVQRTDAGSWSANRPTWEYGYIYDMYPWDTSTCPNGTYRLQAQSSPSASLANATTVSATFTIDNGAAAGTSCQMPSGWVV